MPVNTSNMMEQVYDLFSSLYATRSDGKALLAFDVGVPISPGMFQLETPAPAAPAPPQNDMPIKRPLSPALAVERLSEIANAVLTIGGGSVHRSHRTVDTMVELLLRQSMPLTPDAMAPLGAAKEAVGKAFDLKLGSLSGLYPFRPVYATPVDWYDPDVADNWTSHTLGQQNQTAGPSPAAPPPLSAPVPPAVRQMHPTWRVMPAELRAEAPQPPSPTPQQMPGTRIYAEIRPQAMMQTRAFTTTAAFRPARDLDASAVQLAEARQPVAAVPAQMVRVAPVAQEMMYVRPLLQAQAVAAVNASATTQPVATDSIDLSFEHCVVLLNWPWFPDTLLLTPNWYLPGYQRGVFSNGNGAEDTGLLPVLPSGFVAIRNLKIMAKWSDQDVTAIQGSTSLGPFSLAGHSFDAGSGSLTCPGMQIIGWFCEALPVLPPVADPALVAAATPSSVPVTNTPAPPSVPASQGQVQGDAGTASTPPTPATPASTGA